MVVQGHDQDDPEHGQQAAHDARAQLGEVLHERHGVVGRPELRSLRPPEGQLHAGAAPSSVRSSSAGVIDGDSLRRQRWRIEPEGGSAGVGATAGRSTSATGSMAAGSVADGSMASAAVLGLARRRDLGLAHRRDLGLARRDLGLARRRAGVTVTTRRLEVEVGHLAHRVGGLAHLLHRFVEHVAQLALEA